MNTYTKAQSTQLAHSPLSVEMLPDEIKKLPAATALVWLEGWNAHAAMLNRQCVDHVDGVSVSGTQTAPALDSLPNSDESPSGNTAALVNGVTIGKPLTITLPPLPVLGSTAEWYQGFAAGAGSMRDECAKLLAAAGINVEAK